MKSRSDFITEKEYNEYLRTYTAIAAMQGILANHWCSNDFNSQLASINYELVSEQSVKFSDALIEQLNKHYGK